MRISKNILTSAITVMVAISIVMGTLLYAYKYTSSHMVNNNSFPNGNGRIPQGEFQKKDGNKPQGGAPNGDFKKPGN